LTIKQNGNQVILRGRSGRRKEGNAVDIVVGIFAFIMVLLAIAIVATPTVVSYTQEALIEAPVSEVYDNMRFQELLMLWSAWPSETNSTCACEGVDGALGAKTVFFSKGKRFGHQEVTALAENASVELTLYGAGPPQKPVLTFLLAPAPAGGTKVTLRFRNEIPRPFNLFLRLFGIVRWTRTMHAKDLDGLKRFSEPPHRTYTGEPVDKEDVERLVAEESRE